MDKDKRKAILHMEVQDGDYRPELTHMVGEECDLLALICTALHIYLEGSGPVWRSTARQVVGEILGETQEPESRKEKVLARVLWFVTGCFALIGAFVTAAWIVTKIAGVVG